MREQNLKVCTGPNCKAWSSERIARELIEIQQGLGLDHIKVCRVSCMNSCGGGASIRVNEKAKIVKMKEVDDVLNVLGISESVVAC